MVPFCLKNNVGILPHTSLQKGLLTGKIKPGHVFNDGDYRPSTPYFQSQNHLQVMSLLDEITPIAENKGVSLAQLVINWTMQQPAVTSVLVGVRNVEQMLDNVKATSFQLLNEELEMINTAFKKMGLKS